jgi:hypothetical protein
MYGVGRTLRKTHRVGLWSGSFPGDRAISLPLKTNLNESQIDLESNGVGVLQQASSRASLSILQSE